MPQLRGRDNPLEPFIHSDQDAPLRHAHEDPELRELVDRYVTPGRRYVRLSRLHGDGTPDMEADELAQFQRELGLASHAITPSELGVLLEGGWRERLTAAWLIAVSRRTALREELGRLLLANEAALATQGYCVALVAFGTPADADLLCSYLDRHLRQPRLWHGQAPVIGALLHLDTAHRTDRAERFLAPGGLWDQWVLGPPAKPFDAHDHHRVTERLCTVVAACRQPATPRP